MARQMRGFPDLFLGGFEDPTLVAVRIGTDEGGKGLINRLAVRSESRCKGLGSMLLREMEKRLKKRGLNVISALVEKGNEDSLVFFRNAATRSMGT